MQAVLVPAPGGPEVLTLGDAPDPEPGPGELLVQVRAAGVNRADVLQRMGRYPPPPGASPILGLELSGAVVKAGPDTSRFTTGERIMALVTGGAYAALAVVPEAAALPVFRGLDDVQAAAIPEAFLTAWLNLFDLGALHPGETVLVHAGASGVGSAAIQLAREAEARVITTVGSEAKAALCRDLGAAVVLDRRRDDIPRAVKDATGGAGADLVLDVAGAPAWAGNLELLKRYGRLVLIGFLGGSRGDLDLGPVLRKGLTVRGTTLRGTALADKARIVQAFAAFAGPRFADGRLRAVVDRAIPWAEAAEAHRVMEANANAGKIVLTVGA
jgi:putative PIG3 family NAD(P)H quinone oxidoreductase